MVELRSNLGRRGMLGSLSMPARTDSASKGVDRLCTVCGLCCDGVLFGFVRLGSGDHPERLRAEGCRTRKKGDEIIFDQPCPAHRGWLCAVYDERPQQCRAFVCALLRAHEQGEIDPPEALERIRSAQQLAGQVRALLRVLGEVNEHWPLSRRCQRYLVMAEADNSPVVVKRQRAELVATVYELTQALKRDFYEVDESL